MNIANTVASKLFVAFVAASMLVMLATPAKAQTAEELQAQINTLMAQIAALQGATAPAATAGCTFTRSLTVGSEGADVKCLQDALTPMYFTNAGGSTGYFGPITAAAVAAWQAANGVAPAVGYFGPVSQAKYSALMAVAPTTPSTDDSDNTDDSTSGDLGGEASLDDVTMDSASDDTIDEGQEDAEIGMATLSFVDGDAKVTRMDVRLNGVAKVWNIFDTVSLVVDGDTIATEDASSKSDYLNTSGNAGTIRFSGLDLVAKEDKDVEVSIVVTVNNGVDSSDQGAYSVSVDSLRFVDATDVTTTDSATGDLGDSVSFEVGAAGADDELIVKTSSDDPTSTTLELKDNAKSSWETVFAFDLDTKDSPNDIELTTVYLTVDTAATSTFDGLVDDYELVIDGVTIDKLADANGLTVGDYTNGTTTELAFNVDGDVVINAGDRVTAELKLKFKALKAGDEGATVKAYVTGAQADKIEAVGGDDLTTSQTSGSATGDEHTLRTMGIIGEAGAMSSTLTAGVSGGHDTVNYTMKVDVTAFNQDVYIAKAAATSVRYDKTDSSGTALGSTANTAVDSFTSTADEDGTGDYFYVPEGSTETFTIVVKWSPGAASAATGIQLLGLDYADTNAAENAAWSATPAKDYRTDAKSTNL